MTHPNDLIIRKKLQEIKDKVSWKAKDTLPGVTITSMVNQIEDLLDDRPRPVYVGKEAHESLTSTNKVQRTSGKNQSS